MSEVVRVPVGAGSPEGVNSAYVFSEGSVVDPGPPTEEAWDALRSAISELESIEHVLVTHWHADHAGLAPRLAEEAGATIHMHASDAPLVSEYAAARERRLKRDAAALRRWGVPESDRKTLLDTDAPSPLPERYDVSTHEDGDIVAGLEFVYTPGHTLGHTSFATDETLLLGDLLLPTYTPNVGGSDTRMDDPLAAYLQSIERIVDQFSDGEPGHGTTMNVERAVAEARSHHRDRAKAAFRALKTLDRPTPWTVACELFGEMNGIHAKFGAGEAAAHLERLAACGVVERRGDDPIHYRSRLTDYPSGLDLTP